MMLCPSEIVIDAPHSSNNFRWYWGVYQPDANWASLAEGYAGSKEEAYRAAEIARYLIEYKRGNT